MRRIEPVLTAFFLANWVVGLLILFRVIDSSGALRISLYSLFSVAAAAGWIFGNTYVIRGRRLPHRLRRGLFVIYYVGPLGLLVLLRSMAPRADLVAAPLVPLYSFVVFSILFLVPVTFAKSARTRRRLRLGEKDLDE